MVAVADDAACLLAVRVAMAIMRPGADSLHLLTIARDGAAVMDAARALVERFRDMASVTLGDVQAVAQVRRGHVPCAGSGQGYGRLGGPIVQA